MNEEIEAELTEMYSINDNMEVIEEGNVYKAIPIDLKK